ncbi:MAG: SGNH/GDSL hydrolase family protein [Nocardioides sp.]
MGKVAAARKLASAAAYGGGGLSLLGASLYGVLRAEARLARLVIGRAEGAPPDATGWYGRGRPGPAIKIALLGDSSAVGYGVETVTETPGAILASGVTEQTDRRVYLRQLAVVGAQSSDLQPQVAQALRLRPDLTVIFVGGNDVTHTVLPSASVRHLSEAVRTLADAGSAVVVGTCPDLGTIRPIAPPLRQVARSWSRRLAAAQAIATVEAGGRSVSLGSILGPEFARDPNRLFGPDRFHPSADGYRAMVAVVLPSLLAMLDPAQDEAAPADAWDTRVMSVVTAAVEAVQTPGTELDGSAAAAGRRGVRGRWVQLRQRNRQGTETTTAPEESGAAETLLEDSSSGG